MKYLVAFALFAVAVALPEPVRLLEPAPVELAPLMVPQEVMDDIALTVKVVDAPEVAEDANAYAVNFVDEPVADAAPAIEAEAYAVNFVDEAVNSEDAPVEDASAFAVNFVDEAVNAEAPAVKAAEDVSTFAVNFVDEAVNSEDAPVEDASAFAVNFVDEAVNVEIPAAIKIVEIPLPGSVVLPLDSIVLPSIDAVKVVDIPVESSAPVSPVKFVDVADVDEETPSYMPIKQYPDPRWR